MIYFRNASDKNSSNQENLAIAINVSHFVERFIQKKCEQNKKLVN